MRIIDVLTSPWAILPNKLLEISEIYSAHLKGDKIDIKGIEAKIGRPLENSGQGYEIINGVAIIPVHGVISKRMNLFQSISGGASTELLKRDISDALNDNDVKSILLDVDSPGGSVDGTADIANTIYEARGTKPIVTLGGGLIASAAYWLGAAADKVYITNKTTIVGSIGVVATHVDYSEANKSEGIKVTEITAGKYKRMSSEHEPLSKEGRAEIKSDIDYLYSVFVEDVAKFKNVSVQTVLEDMADGRTFIGAQSVEAGLVDGIMTLEGVINELSKDNTVDTTFAGALSRNSLNEKPNEENLVNINKEFIQKEHPEVADALIAEGKNSVDLEAVSVKAADEERQRIQNVLAQGMAGHEALVEGLAFDGKTTGPEAAVAVLKAEKEIRATHGNSLKNDADEIPDDLSSTGEETTSAEGNTPKQKWDANKDLRAEFDDDFESYSAYIDATGSGLSKTIGIKGA